jgi:dihydrodipicolinate synthase/N-acetylneuraminate lyase
VKGLESLIEHILQGGVHGLFVLGTTGEGPGLGHATKDKVVRRVCEQVNGRVPVLVGITNSSMEESLLMSERSTKAGADAAVLAPPPYFSTLPSELVDYVEMVAARCPIPIFLYNIPGNTKVTIGWSTVVTTSEIPGVIGYKDSSGDMVDLHKVLQKTANRENFSIMIGREELLGEALIWGVDGGVVGGANIFPRLYTALFEAARQHKVKETQRLHNIAMDVSRSFYELDSSSVGYIKSTKAYLALMGICKDYMTPPFKRLEPAQKTILEKRFRELDLDSSIGG